MDAANGRSIKFIFKVNNNCKSVKVGLILGITLV